MKLNNMSTASFKVVLSKKLQKRTFLATETVKLDTKFVHN